MMKGILKFFQSHHHSFSFSHHKMSFNPLHRPEINQANRKDDDKKNVSELPGFWTLSIVRYSKKLENTTFRKLDLFPSSGERGGTYSVEFSRES
jgi:hypothetical protein